MAFLLSLIVMVQVSASLRLKIKESLKDAINIASNFSQEVLIEKHIIILNILYT